MKILLPILAFLIPFSVYVYTLYPTIAPGDSTEMVTAAIVLGVPHQPSYPLNTIIGHLFSKLPIHPPGGEAGKSVEWRVNLASAVMQSLTVLVFYFLLLMLMRANSERIKANELMHSHIRYSSLEASSTGRISLNLHFAAFSAAMFLAFNLIFWEYATKFEVFPLNNLLAVSLLLLALKISNSNKTILPAGKTNAKFVIHYSLFIVLAGFALVHHQTIILIFPLLIYLIIPLVKEKLTDEVFWTKTIGLFVLGMLPFLSILIISAGQPLLNWGNVHDIGGVLSALVRKDFGIVSSFLVGFEPTVRPFAFDQVVFYLKNIFLDYSIVGCGLALIGAANIYRKNKRMFWILLTGWIITGPVFLSYANFPLGDNFNQATARRFQMLPDIFVTMFLGFGIYYLFSRMSANFKRINANEPMNGDNLLIREHSLKIRSYSHLTSEAIGSFLGMTLLVFSFIYPFMVNFPKANARNNNLTLKYTLSAYGSTEPNALILLSGDIADMTGDYYNYVVINAKCQMTNDKCQSSRIIFTPGQFHLNWFIPQLTARYPDLIIPAPFPGNLYTTTTQIVEANFGSPPSRGSGEARPIYIGPDLVAKDPGIENKYVLWPKNLLFLVKKKGEDLKLEEFSSENKNLWESLDLSLLKSIAKKNPVFEDSIVFYYARHFYNVGHVFESVKLYEDAIREYKRVLEINPFFKEALAGLGRIYGYNLDPADYAKAIDYLQKYRSVLGSDDGELAQAAQGMIYELTDKANKEAQEVPVSVPIQPTETVTKSGVKNDEK